jgi:hypothetical protein
MPVINRDLVSHHANRVLHLVAEDDDGPLTPASDVVIYDWGDGDTHGETLQGRFRAVDSDGVAWVVTVAPASIQDRQ